MSKSIRLSVVTPVFNTSAEHLKALRDSLPAALGDVGYEWLLVDDGSDDPSTLTMLRDLATRPSVRLLRNAGRKGAGGARNHGAAVAAAARLMFVDADDVLLPGAAQQLLEAMEQRPQIRWLAGEFEQFDADGPPQAVAAAQPLLVEHWPDAANRLVFETLFNQGSYLIERDLFFDAGGFDDDFVLGEDWMLWMRLAIRGELYHCNLLVFWQRRGHVSLMSGSLAATSAIVAPYLALRRDPRFAEQKQLLRWRIFRLYRLLAERNQALGERARAIRFALLAAIWAVNEPQQWANVLRAAAGVTLR